MFGVRTDGQRNITSSPWCWSGSGGFRSVWDLLHRTCNMRPFHFALFWHISQPTLYSCHCCSWSNILDLCRSSSDWKEMMKNVTCWFLAVIRLTDWLSHVFNLIWNRSVIVNDYHISLKLSKDCINVQNFNETLFLKQTFSSFSNVTAADFWDMFTSLCVFILT